MTTTRLSGKELALLLGVSPAALSKAVKNKHYCAKYPVYKWAVSAESGRIEHFRLNEWTMAAVCLHFRVICSKTEETGSLSRPHMTNLPPRLQGIVEKVMEPELDAKPPISFKSAPHKSSLPAQRPAQRPDLPYPKGRSNRDKTLWWVYTIGKAFVEYQEERRGSLG